MTAGGRNDKRAPALFSVRVHPSARRAGVEKLGPREYKVHVTAAPEKGRANREVLESLAAHLNIPISRLRLVRGAASRIKMILVEGNADIDYSA
ncbi:MAG: hypothetical protein A2W03_14510 [Candidatus Aminicenantes bacterium RBG_16_63_16]|nr:MAG: hypothetical protein A2W03_14510 [Candidatus Aminicenantes bacterium RBG_16_63_16]